METTRWRDMQRRLGFAVNRSRDLQPSWGRSRMVASGTSKGNETCRSRTMEEQSHWMAELLRCPVQLFCHYWYLLAHAGKEESWRVKAGSEIRGVKFLTTAVISLRLRALD